MGILACSSHVPPARACDARDASRLTKGVAMAEDPAADSSSARTGRGRTALAVVLVVLGALLAPVAAVAAWSGALVDDTDRWVATVGPLSDEPAVQQAVTDRLTAAIVDAIDVPQLAGDLTSAVAGLGLPARLAGLVESLQGPLADAVTDLVRRTVGQVVTSDEFSTAWVEANRVAHRQLVATLRGDPGAIAQVGPDGTLSVQLTTVIDAVRQRLVERGFTILERLPQIDATFPLVAGADLVRFQDGYRLLHALGTWLPWVSLVLLAGGVLTARHRSRTLVVAGLALAGAMLVLAVGLAVGRSLYAQSLPATVQRPDVAVLVYDQVVSFLRVAVRAVAVLGLVVALVAFVTGGSPAARPLRSSWSRTTSALRRAGDRRGVSTGPVGRWLDAQRGPVRVVVVGVAALVLTLADRITPALVGWTALVAIVVLLVASLLARPAPDELAAPSLETRPRGRVVR